MRYPDLAAHAQPAPHPPAADGDESGPARPEAAKTEKIRCVGPWPFGHAGPAAAEDSTGRRASSRDSHALHRYS